MPLYELECDHCMSKFEKICSYNKLSEQRCPFCLSSAIKNKVSKSGFKIFGFAAWNNYSIEETHYDPSMNK